MNRNLKLVVNNTLKKERNYFFEKDELKSILNLYAKWFQMDPGKTTAWLFPAKKLYLVFLRMQLKMLSIKFVKLLNQ